MFTSKAPADTLNLEVILPKLTKLSAFRLNYPKNFNQIFKDEHSQQLSNVFNQCANLQDIHISAYKVFDRMVWLASNLIKT